MEGQEGMAEGREGRAGGGGRCIGRLECKPPESRPEAGRLGILESKAPKPLGTPSPKLLCIYPHGVRLDKESAQIVYCFSEEMSPTSCQLKSQKSLN